MLIIIIISIHLLRCLTTAIRSLLTGTAEKETTNITRKYK
jgi:hypothetical protein